MKIIKAILIIALAVSLLTFLISESQSEREPHPFFKCPKCNSRMFHLADDFFRCGECNGVYRFIVDDVKNIGMGGENETEGKT